MGLTARNRRVTSAGSKDFQQELLDRTSQWFTASGSDTPVDVSWDPPADMTPPPDARSAGPAVPPGASEPAANSSK